MSRELVQWVADNVFSPGRLATVLVVIFLLMFMGLLPSPVLTAALDAQNEHREMEALLRQICINTAQSAIQATACWPRP